VVNLLRKKIVEIFPLLFLDLLGAIKKIKDTSRLMKLKLIKKEELDMFFMLDQNLNLQKNKTCKSTKI